MATPMRPAIDLLSQYAAYHRDRRNIATHFVGVPLIVFAVGLLLSKPAVTLAGFVLTPAWLLFLLAALWYVSRGEFTLGVATSAAICVLLLVAQQLSGGATGTRLTWGAAVFTIGWIFQFVGHYYEGRKPAFADDIVGLLVGPMFVTAEALFSLGWGKDLMRRIEASAGPTYLRDLAHSPVR